MTEPFRRVPYWNNELPYPEGPYTVYYLKRELARLMLMKGLKDIKFYISLDLLEGKKT